MIILLWILAMPMAFAITCAAETASHGEPFKVFKFWKHAAITLAWPFLSLLILKEISVKLARHLLED